MNKPYLSVKEVQQLIPFSEKWIYLHLEDIPGYFRLGKSILFDKDILLKGLKDLATNYIKPRKSHQTRTDSHGLMD
jgi:hypothetical protein